MSPFLGYLSKSKLHRSPLVLSTLNPGISRSFVSQVRCQIKEGLKFTPCEHSISSKVIQGSFYKLHSCFGRSISVWRVSGVDLPTQLCPMFGSLVLQLNLFPIGQETSKALSGQVELPQSSSRGLTTVFWGDLCCESLVS